MRRGVIISITLASVVLLSAGPASAGPPTREPLPTPNDFTISDCGFDILSHVLVNNEVQTTFFDKDGNVVRQLVTGTLKARLTNVATDESIDLNISGPGTYTFPPDGSVDLVGTGGWLNGFTNRPGEVLFSKGRFEATFPPDGSFLLTDPAPIEIDMCDVLGPA